MNISKYILVAVSVFALAAPDHARQAPGGRESSPAAEPGRQPRATKGNPAARNPKRSSRDARSKDRKPETPATAALSISVKPADSTVNLQGTDYHAENGLLVRGGLTPGKYRIVVHRDGYQDEGYEIALGPGDDTPLSVSLKPLSGILNVAPLVADTEIHVIESVTGKSVGTYSGPARHIQLPPGRYQVLVSKEGYRTTVREVVIEPAASVFIEPPLAPLPDTAASLRRPAPPPFSRDYATQAQTDSEGKFVVVTLTGRSGDTANALGAVEVTMSVVGGQARVTNISGMLTGYPCQVDFVRLENVAEYSFVEPPGAANQWARAVVRLRPKESKRPVHFLINWKSLLSSVPGGSPFN
jgi:nucleoid-associated protein YgaU